MNLSIIIPQRETLLACLRPLWNALDRQGVAYENIRPGELPFSPEGAVIALEAGAIEGIPPDTFAVLLATDLFGLKESSYYQSEGDLNIVAGRRGAYRMRAEGRSFVVGGYPRWDEIYPLRHRVRQVKSEICRDLGIPPGKPIVCLYPSFSRLHQPNLWRTEGILRRCREELGDIHLILQVHPAFLRATGVSLDALRLLQEREGTITCLRGRELECIAACDLFVTDISSTTAAAISLDKPVLFLPMDPLPQGRGMIQREIEDFQSHGERWDRLDDLGALLARGSSSDTLRELLISSITGDDDRHCERIIDTIGEAMDGGARGRGRSPVHRAGVANFEGGAFPSFLGIGTMKAGTTWLNENLSCHPEIYICGVREPHFFDWHYERGLAHYEGLFRAGQGRIRGEVTPGYCIMPPDRIQRVKELMPQGRFILLMRNPIDRAWSHGRMELIKRGERSFEEVRGEEFLAHFHSRRSIIRGSYLRMLDNWLSLFSREQLFIGVYEDIKGRPKELLREIFDHIGASKDVDWESFPLARVIHRGVSVSMPEGFRHELRGIYGEEIRGLYDRLGDVLAPWLGDVDS